MHRNPRRTTRTRAFPVIACVVALLVITASGCAKSPRVELGSGTVTTVKPGGTFDIVVHENASIGDDYKVTSVDNGVLAGSDYSEDSPGSAGGGGEVTFHIVAGDTPGPGKVTVRYCYRGCGGKAEDGKPDRDEIVAFVVS